MIDITDAALLARQMYADGATVAAIRAATKLKYGELYYWLDGGEGRLPPLPRRIRKSGHSRGKLFSRGTMIRRLMRLAELQVSEVERRSAAVGVELPDPEGNGRAIAVLARTMRELTALEMQNQTPAPPRGQKQSDDELIPRDFGELRRSLAKKLEDLVARRQGALSEPPDE